MEEQCILRAPKDLARRFHKVCLGLEPVHTDHNDNSTQSNGAQTASSASASGRQRGGSRQQQQRRNQQPFLQLQRIDEPTEDIRQAATQAYQNGNIPSSSSSAATVAAEAASQGQATEDQQKEGGKNEDGKDRNNVRKDITYKAPEFDYFEVTIQGNEKYNAVLVDLPTLVETHRTNDHKQYYKSGNISKMLYILQPGNTNPSEELTIVDAPMRDNVLNSGLTPPTRHIVKRRFWKAHRKAQGKFSADEINHAENMIYEISARKGSEIARWDLIEPPQFMKYWPEKMQEFTIRYKNGIAEQATEFKPTEPIPTEDEETTPSRRTMDWAEPIHPVSAGEVSEAPSSQVEPEPTSSLPLVSNADDEDRDDEDLFVEGEEDENMLAENNYEAQLRSEQEVEMSGKSLSSIEETTGATNTTQETATAPSPTSEVSTTEANVTESEVQSSSEVTAVATTTTDQLPSAASTENVAEAEVEEDPEVKSLKEQVHRLQSEIDELERKKRAAKNVALRKKFDKNIADKNEALDKTKASLQAKQGQS
eukprot:gb/GECG01012065.1/.p1 GENE.gb/GECG01012065.1/~~gb/GECG01012065.1/.p1  ORF type:complete len:537 (+),score=101.53 gb/GECG01012065.1/:1-1611(+)